MKNQITTYLDNAISVLLMLVAGATPLIFLNQTTEFFETPKLIFLSVSTLLLLGLWIASWIFKGKVSITRTPLDIPLLALLGVIILSTFFSATKYSSIFGNLPSVHGSAVAWTTYILLYFIAVSNFRSVAKIKTFLYVLYASATVAALVSLLSFFNVFLPFSFAQAANFTPTGSSFSTIAFLILLLPLPLVSLVRSNRFMPVAFALPLSILFVIVISLIGSVPSYVALFVVFALCIVVSRSNESKKVGTLLLVPMLVAMVTLVLTYAPLPKPLNGLAQLAGNFPREIQLPFVTSWKVSASAFRDAPFIGTGPSTYSFNFSAYKPLEFNLLRFWSFSFESAYNEYLQVLGTLGVFGFAALVLISLIILRTSWKLLTMRSSEETGSTSVVLPALAVSGILTVVLLAIHATTLVSTVITLFIFATLMMSQREIREKVMELGLGIRATTSDNKQFDLFPVLLFIIFLIGAVPAFIKLVGVVSADYYHRQALSQASKSGTLTYQYLQKAESQNPQADLYRVDMAQTNFALANAIASKQKPGENTLTDQEKQTIQTLLSQAINEGRAAVILNPRSARNWSVLASIYRNISGVANNALAFSLDAYGKGIQRDPLNPVLRLNVGGIYYTAKNYDQAIRFFSDAINLKPDYANAYYNLTIALRDKGDLQNAKAVAQQMIVLLQKDTNSNDYKIAKALLDSIDAKIADTTQKAPAAETTSALGKENVPGVNVSNLNNPPQVTPAPSVKPNPNAKIPQPTAAPSISPTKTPIQ